MLQYAPLMHLHTYNCLVLWTVSLFDCLQCGVVTVAKTSTSSKVYHVLADTVLPTDDHPAVADLANSVAMPPRPSPFSQAWATAAWPTDPLARPPQLTAHRCLAYSAHCCLSLGTDTGLPSRAPVPPRKQLSRTSAGRGQMSSPLHINLVNI